LALGTLLGLALPHAARAQDIPRLAWDSAPGVSPRALAVDGGFVAGPPLTLPAGMLLGVGGGASVGRRIALGVRASFATATESSLYWTVTHEHVRLHAAAAVQGAVGRGALALRLGAGPTFVHERRTRNEAARAGAAGGDLASSALATLPAAELEAVVALRIAGPWLFTASAGPAVLIEDGALHGGWTAALGVGWRR
jgi:hypothetical protein